MPGIEPKKSLRLNGEPNPSESPAHAPNIASSCSGGASRSARARSANRPHRPMTWTSLKYRTIIHGYIRVPTAAV